MHGVGGCAHAHVYDFIAVHIQRNHCARSIGESSISMMSQSLCCHNIPRSPTIIFGELWIVYASFQWGESV